MEAFVVAPANSNCDDLGPTSSPADARFCACAKEFESHFPDELSCWNVLIAYSDELGLLGCRACGAYKPKRKGVRTIVCNGCKSQRSASSGTVFERVRRLKPYFVALWFFEHGVTVNSVRLAKYCDLAQSSALAILRKLRCVVDFHMRTDLHYLPSLSFAGSMLRRSFETPARQHPRDEEDEHHKAAPGTVPPPPGGSAKPGASAAAPGTAPAPTPAAASPTTGAAARPAGASSAPVKLRKTSKDYPQLSQDEKALFDLLDAGSKSFTYLLVKTGLTPNSLLAAITALELEGLVIEKGGTYELVQNAVSQCPLPARYLLTSINPANNTSALAKVKVYGVALISPSLDHLQKVVHDFLVANFNGVSRKYLQLYMSDYWCHWDRKRWKRSALLVECLLFKPISYREIMQFVTAPIMRVPARLAA